MYSMTLKNFTTKDSVETPIKAAAIGGVCLKALIDNISPEFCWKRRVDKGQAPNCLQGFTRTQAHCIQSCK